MQQYRISEIVYDWKKESLENQSERERETKWRSKGDDYYPSL